MLYFAYGSNLLTMRMQSRVPSARFHCRAMLRGHRLVFTKIGRDGTGKATIDPIPADIPQESPGDCVFGVVYNISPRHKPSLDRAESLGCGYERIDCEVKSLDTRPCHARLQVFTYQAPPEYRDATLRPNRWYRKMVLDGATEQHLPGDYIAMLAEAQPMDSGRDARTSAWMF